MTHDKKQFKWGHPRIVPGRGEYAGQVFVLHGCLADGPYTWEQAQWAYEELLRNPVRDDVYADLERRRLGGIADHSLSGVAQ